MKRLQFALFPVMANLTTRSAQTNSVYIVERKKDEVKGEIIKKGKKV